MWGSARSRVLLGLAVAALVAVAGALYYSSSAPPAAATLRILVRDAGGGWAHLNVTFSEVNVHPAGGTNDTGWVSVPVTDRTIDFISLGNLTTVLALGTLAPGKYTQLRIVVSEAVGLPASGPLVNMTIPDQGILKTAVSFLLPPGGGATVTLDFDLSHSIQQAGGEWIFTPVLGSVDIT